MDKNEKEKDQQDRLIEALMTAVTEAYFKPSKAVEDKNGHMKLNALADEFKMTSLKIRKILITTGAYVTEKSKNVNELKAQGKEIEEIQAIMHLSRASVQSYLPYQKTVYKLEERSGLAERLERYRLRKKKMEQLILAIDHEEMPLLQSLLWDTLEAFENYPFKTVKNLHFTYKIKGNEMFCNRKKKSITRATIEVAFENAMEMKMKGTRVTGPKKLNCFGASYLYPIFTRIGVI